MKDEAKRNSQIRELKVFLTKVRGVKNKRRGKKKLPNKGIESYSYAERRNNGVYEAKRNSQIRELKDHNIRG